MVNKMAKNIGYLISLNDEYLYSAAHGEMYAPLRVNERAVQKLQRAMEANTPDDKSCIRTIAGIWYNGKFMLATEFRDITKCTANLRNPSHLAKTELCYKTLCNGKCRDAFMRTNVAQYILPELYGTKQK
jgi:hypothetical protein